MGQQQLLLLVLGVVIVGLAVVVGIQAFSENQKSANADAMVNDGVRIASDIQAWALKPAAFGGNGGWDGTPPDFNDLGYQTGGDNATDTQYENVNGVYSLDGSGSDCTTDPSAPSGKTTNLVYISANSTTTGNDVCVVVAGTDHEDVGTVVEIGT